MAAFTEDGEPLVVTEDFYCGVVVRQRLTWRSVGGSITRRRAMGPIAPADD